MKWLITGVSSGIGHALAKEVLADGNIVYGTLRTPEDLKNFESLHPGRAIGLILDLKDSESIPGVVQKAECDSGGLDVLVNNAGYGLVGAVEAISVEEEARLALAGCQTLLNRETAYALVFDIGGGSTEIVWAERTGTEQFQIVDVLSLPIGVVAD